MREPWRDDMLDFSSALFWYKFMFVTELAIAEALTTYTLAKRNRFILRVVCSMLGMYALAFWFPIAAYNAA